MPAAGAFRAFGAADLRAFDEGFMEKGLTPLDAILNDNADEAPPRDERGRFAAKAEPEAEPETGVTAAQATEPEPQAEVPPTPAVEQEPERIPLSALKDERAKRQQLEQELAAYRAQIQQHHQPQPQQPAHQAEPDEAPDPIVDPVGYAQWVEGNVLGRINEQRVRQSAQAARTRYQDFDHAVTTFQQMAAANPVLEQMMLQQPDPAEWAYRTAKTHLEVAQYGNLEAAVEARVAAALEQKLAEFQAKAAKPAIPASLATERNVGSRTNPVPWNGPVPIGDILSR